MLPAIIIPHTYIADPGTWLLVVEIVNNVVVRFNLSRGEVLPLVWWQGFYLFSNKNRTEQMLLFMI